jgi:hypothetical protein
MESDGDFFTDCVVYKESGTNYAYFTNGITPMKKLPLVITKNGKGDLTKYTEEEITLIRRGFRGSITDIEVRSGNGGDLVSGTYQFAVRLYNNTERKYTKWSMISQPTFVGIDATTTSENYGGVGFVSDSDINLTMTWEEDYVTSSLYTHYQIAVIENLNGDPDRQATVKVLQPETLSASSNVYNYDTNKLAKELINIDELTVDDAAIKAVKTLRIKNNRMIAGNIDYHPLDYDNGDPIVGSATAPIDTGRSLTGLKAVGYRDPDNATNKVGYFRDELYRFGVVYEDEFGNFSKPKILDFSGLTGNAADATSPDFRFPARTDGKYGALLDGSGDIQALGLAIKGLDNHPSWAVAAHIVRVPRKKKVLFQTPLVPSILVQPAKAGGDYPDQRSSTEETELDPLNVEAANPDGSFVPKNFYHTLPKNMVRFGDLSESTGNYGSVYATHSNTTIGTYAVVTTGVYDVDPSTSEDELFSTNESTLIVTMEKKVGGVYGAFDIGVDVGLFTLQYRTIGNSTWIAEGQTQNINSVGEPEFTGLDLTTNDYRIVFTNS